MSQAAQVPVVGAVRTLIQHSIQQLNDWRHRLDPIHWAPLTARLAVRAHTRPLICIEHRLIVLISPKSACTSTLIWFLRQAGLYQTAWDYDRWPHNYRTRIYNKSDVFERALKIGLQNFSILRVVRDPWSRAVSSFRHALTSGYANRGLNRRLHIPVARPLKLSFRQFLQFLELENLRTANGHHALQHHPLEDLYPPRWVINVSQQNLYSELNRVEAELALPHTDFDHLEWAHQLHRKREFHHRADLPNADELMLTRHHAHRGPWPSDSALLTASNRERIARLYAVDVCSYIRDVDGPA